MRESEYSVKQPGKVYLGRSKCSREEVARIIAQMAEELSGAVLSSLGISVA